MPIFAYPRPGARLAGRGGAALVHDPLYTAAELAGLGPEPATLEPPPAVDAIIVQTAHPNYRTLDFRRFPGLAAVLDGRAALDPAAVTAAGVAYLAIGRAPTGPAPSDAVAAAGGRDQRAAMGEATT
ncbi:MAG: hypothetical protein U0531_08350 [Dehalococcoidia bacterium]